MFKKMLLASTAITLAAPSAFAQPAAGSEQSAGIEQVVVTSTRIVRNGFSAPTPTTVVSEDLLRQNMAPNIAQTLDQLPQFGTGQSQENAPSVSASPGTAGVQTINLRNLGTSRTLVLFDGQRVVAATTSGGVDTSTLPAALVQRVDIVTGGASAQWGSDAVAGVVNLVLNKNFTGLDASLEGQRSWRGDDNNGKASVTWGTRFFDDKANVILSGTYSDHPGYVYSSDRGWYHATRLVLNPTYTATNGQPRIITRTNVAEANVTAGGAVASGPLAGIQFGPNGVPMPYNPGFVSGTLSFGGDEDDLQGQHVSLSAPIREGTFFAYAGYDITPDLRASVQLNWGGSDASNQILPYVRANNVPIAVDNAYLDPAIKARMVTLGVTSFNLGTTNTELGWTTGVNQRTLLRGVFTLDGKFGDNWSWTAYYQAGQTLATSHILQNELIANYNLAVDAVRNPATGTIVCRSTLTNPTNGCVPLDVLGTGVESAAAIKYVDGPPNSQHILLTQRVAAASLQNSDLFDLPAGPISLATGAEARWETANAVYDALSNQGAFYVGANKNIQGKVSVVEGFVETVVPLLKDIPLVNSLDLNAAMRVTSYSTSGLVETWKVGLSWTVFDDLRLRGTKSRDIRAPSVLELYNPASNSTRIIPDPFTNTQPQVHAVTLGNPNLKPENADTTTAGFVYTPSWLPGFQGSVDYYRVAISGAIGSVTQENVIKFCYAGQAAFCPLVIRNAAGQVTEIDSAPTNTQTAGTNGFDFEAQYRTDLMGGTLRLNEVANFTEKFTTTSNGILYNSAGQISADASPATGLPRFKSLFSATYTLGPISGTLRSRYIGPARLLNAWTSADVDRNDVPGINYFDLQGSYDFDHAQIYFALNNMFDKDPPAVPPGWDTNSPYIRSDTVLGLYDAIGREIRVGIRVNY